MKEILGFVIIIVCLIYAAIHLDSVSCTQKAVSFEDYQYGVFSGCMVKHKGMWLPLENIRGFD